MMDFDDYDIDIEDDDDLIIDLSCLSPDVREAALRSLRVNRIKDTEEKIEEKRREEKPEMKSNGLLPQSALERLAEISGMPEYRRDNDEQKWASYAAALNSIEIKERRAENVNDRELYRRLRGMCEKHHLSDSIAKAFLPPVVSFLQGREIKPIIIYGPEGSGKSYFAALLAELVERPFVSISAAGGEYSHGYHGEGSSYKSPDLGGFVKGIIENKSDSCVFLIDEIDKAAASPMTRVSQQDELLTIISNKAVRDNFLGFPISLASSIIMFAVNDMSCLSRPFKDRCSAVEFKPVERSKVLEILQEHVKNNVIPGYSGKITMDGAMLAAASDELYSRGVTSIRQHETFAETAAYRAYNRYLSSDEDSTAVTEEDLAEAAEELYIFEEERKEIGFRSAR